MKNTDQKLAQRRDESFSREIEAAKSPEPDYQDPEGSLTNLQRSEFAEAALRAYNLRTGSDLETVIRDLIGDLGHFCDRHRLHGLDLAAEIESAREMYLCETEGRGKAFEPKD